MECMVPGCDREGRNRVAIRLRKPSPSPAVYAPDTHAVLCKQHAEAGGKYTITYEPGAAGTVETVVVCGGVAIDQRVTPIRRSAA